MHMRKISIYLLIIVSLMILTQSLSATAIAEEMPGMPDMDSEQQAQDPAEIPPGPGDRGYKPIEEPADDSTMAIIVAVVFGLPVAIWLVVRSVKKAQKKPKKKSK